MKKILALFLLLLIVGCGASKQEYRIPDITKPEMITLNKHNNQGNIYSISISGRGQIDGEATISLILNGKPYKIKRLSGSILFQWVGDWYSNSAEIQYEPLAVKNGNLSLTYHFRDI